MWRFRLRPSCARAPPPLPPLLSLSLPPPPLLRQSCAGAVLLLRVNGGSRWTLSGVSLQLYVFMSLSVCPRVCPCLSVSICPCLCLSPSAGLCPRLHCVCHGSRVSGVPGRGGGLRRSRSFDVWFHTERSRWGVRRDAALFLDPPRQGCWTPLPYEGRTYLDRLDQNQRT